MPVLGWHEAVEYWVDCRAESGKDDKEGIQFRWNLDRMYEIVVLSFGDCRRCFLQLFPTIIAYSTKPWVDRIYNINSSWQSKSLSIWNLKLVLIVKVNWGDFFWHFESFPKKLVFCSEFTRDREVFQKYRTRVRGQNHQSSLWKRKKWLRKNAKSELRFCANKLKEAYKTQFQFQFQFSKSGPKLKIQFELTRSPWFNDIQRWFN